MRFHIPELREGGSERERGAEIFIKSNRSGDSGGLVAKCAKCLCSRHPLRQICVAVVRRRKRPADTKYRHGSKMSKMTTEIWPNIMKNNYWIYSIFREANLIWFKLFICVMWSRNTESTSKYLLSVRFCSQTSTRSFSLLRILKNRERAFAHLIYLLPHQHLPGE